MYALSATMRQVSAVILSAAAPLFGSPAVAFASPSEVATDSAPVVFEREVAGFHPLSREQPTSTVSVRVPTVGVATGETSWNTLAFTAVIKYPQTSPQLQKILLSVSINGATALQTTLEPTAAGIKQRTVTLLSADTNGTSPSAKEIPLSASNYIQSGSLHIGENLVRIKVEGMESDAPIPVVKIQKVILNLTNIDPNHIQLTVPRNSLVVRPGQEFDLQYRLNSAGGRPETAGEVSINAAEMGGTGVTSSHFEQIGSGKDGKFRLRFDKPGLYPLMIKVRPDKYNAASRGVLVSAQTHQLKSFDSSVALEAGGISCLLFAVVQSRRAKTERGT